MRNCEAERISSQDGESRPLPAPICQVEERQEQIPKRAGPLMILGWSSSDRLNGGIHLDSGAFPFEDAA